MARFETEDLVRAYAMYEEMMQYPHLVEEMRTLFLEALVREGEVTPGSLREEARAVLGRNRSAGASDAAHASDSIGANGANEEAGVEESPANPAEGGFPGDEDLQRIIRALIDLHFARRFDASLIRSHINLARKRDAFRKLHQVVNMEGVTSIRIKRALKDFCLIPEGRLILSPEEAEGVRVALIDHFVSNQLPFIGIAKKHITVRDVDDLIDRSLWNRRRSGKIGGKAAGMFLANKILLPRFGERDPELARHVVMPESYYLNSGTLSDFIDYNGLYSLHTQKYKNREVLDAEYENISHLLDRASFPPDVVEDFRKLLTELGEHPLIVRSSSHLEDNIGFAFSGKYESVFLPNQGDIRTRLNDFMWGLKQVLRSTFSPAAILYRRDHQLLDFDERMSVLVQKVAGRRFGPYFFPFAAGVAFSQNPHTWSPRLVREEGMVRLVLGLGTRAVDRTGPGYPRFVPLSHPTFRPEVTVEKIRKYSQKMVDVINLESRRFETVPFHDLFAHVSHPDLFFALSTDRDGHLAPPLFRGQEVEIARSCITFDNLITKSPFIPLLKKVLKLLENAYGRPVDVEFAWDDDRLTILQCRSLAVGGRRGRVTLPKGLPEEHVLFRNKRDIANSAVVNLEYVVYVDPKAYGRLRSAEERLSVGRVVSRINRLLGGKRYALFGPGRWGTNDLMLGVKVGYEDINYTQVLGEIAFEEDGGTPEVSYGTHFFSDLVEAGIVSLAIYPDEPGTLFEESFFLQSPNDLAEMAPELEPSARVVKVIHVPACRGGRLLHIYQDAREGEGVGFFGEPVVGSEE